MRPFEFHAGSDIGELYRVFAAEAEPTSPIWGTLCTWIAETPEACVLLERLPEAKRQPNLFLGAVRYLDGPTAPGSGFLEWMGKRWAEIEQIVRTHATQTNEPGRCAVLYPFLAALPQPLALIEVGMSAGLCLFPDRYGYRYHASADEVLAGSSTVGWRFDCEVVPFSPPQVGPIEVVWRAGIDLNPLDPNSPVDARWLRSLVWPGQPDREQRLADSLKIAATEPVRQVRGDLVAELPGLVQQAPLEATVVVFHTAVLAYLDRAARERFVETVSTLDVTWISNEGFNVTPGVADRLPTTEREGAEFVLAVDGRPVARTQPHGRSLRRL